MNLDVRQVDGEVLVVSQFTLQAATRKGNRLFVHIFDCKEKELTLPLGCKVKKACTYGDRKAVKFKQAKGEVKLFFDEVPSGVDYIIELTTK